MTLAIHGGPPAVTIPSPHAPWPPPALDDEQRDLVAQRDLDISIRGRVAPIRDLEDEFLAFLEHQRRYAITFNSGTSALFAAYVGLGVDEGAEVIGPALTYQAALSPVYALKGDVVLADVRYDTRCIDPDGIEARITERTRVITVVHQWGHPCDMDRILAIAARHDLRIVEDCSNAHGSRYKGRLCGTFGDVAAFSMQGSKGMYAGEGGILVTDDDEIHDRATLLGHNRHRSQLEVVDPALQRFWVTGFGLKLRMSPFNAIVARHALRHFPERMRARHRCLNYLREQLRAVEYLDPIEISDDVDMGAWYGFMPLYRPEVLGGLSKPALIDALRAEGVEVIEPGYPCLATVPLFREEKDIMFPGRLTRPNSPEDVPVAIDLEARMLSLPTFTDWPGAKEIIDQYVEAFQKVGREYRALL